MFKARTIEKGAKMILAILLALQLIMRSDTACAILGLEEGEL
jgi:hypothetical protein